MDYRGAITFDIKAPLPHTLSLVDTAVNGLVIG